jgi:hypothetical protein
MSKAPDNASGLETVAWMETAAMAEPFTGYLNAAYGLKFGKYDLVCRTDASRLLAQKDAELQRLREALSDCLDDLEYLAKAPDSSYARPDDETISKARAALNP